MKTLPAGLAAHVALGTTSLAWLLKITRTDAVVFAFTSATDDITIGGVTYLSAPGLNISSIVLSAGLNVDNLELTTLDDGSTFTRGDVLSGRWRNSFFTISRCNFRNLADGIEPIMAGTVGDVRMHNGYIVAELRGLQQYLQQTIGAVTSKTCRARLGDGRCRKDLSAFTFDAAVTASTNNQAFVASALTQPDDFFGNGELHWLTGTNEGLSCVVKVFAGGEVTLLFPMYSTIDIGDTFRVVAGCRKRREPDCRDKFGNTLNMQAEPDTPGIDAMTAKP